jgi:hypothetical protein
LAKQGETHFYIRADVGRGRDVITELEKRGGKNLNLYKGNGDNSTIYYIDRNGTIQLTHEDEELGYVLVNGGWTEVKLKQPKKERMFVISVREGNDHCKKCHLYEKCDDAQEKKCELASLLKIDKQLDGKTLSVIEVDPDDIPFHVITLIKEQKDVKC